MFVDFKRTFDMLSHEVCVGKLLQMGIPGTYENWNLRWSEGGTGFVERG
jgi:hypothetical protein